MAEIEASTERILEIFTKINEIPRCSRNEARIGAWLMNWASEHDLEAEQDEVKNVLIRVPASEGYEQAATVVIQGHMDMVCEKTPESTHDFSKDPIAVIRDGDWIHAKETTLGADNGIAIALALAVVEEGVPHPALEIIITVDEETGLTGAQELRAGWLSGTQLLNIDSEDDGIFTVGCAGGQTTYLMLPVAYEQTDLESIGMKVSVSGLRGGHSGVNIHEQRANANVLLTRFLQAVEVAVAHGGKPYFSLASITGGSAHNAIPRDAEATLVLSSEHKGQLAEFVADFEQTLQAEHASIEPGLALTVSECETPPEVMTDESARRLLDLLAALPHGVLRMSADVEGLVETSTNLATIKIKDGVEIGTSQRSSFSSRLAQAAGQVTAAARLAGASVRVDSRYPAWEPDMESSLLSRAKKVYNEQFGSDPVIEVIHAGLECGVIGAKYPGMEMISFGPTITGAHSPDERLQVSTLSRAWQLLAALLASYGG
ncbi:MAG: aminoacyl-histidine dipeptidase [Spirochaetales bacterium]